MNFLGYLLLIASIVLLATGITLLATQSLSPFVMGMWIFTCILSVINTINISRLLYFDR